MPPEFEAKLAFIKLEKSEPAPLYLQLYHQIRQGVLSGRLEPGVRLPTSRSLAERLSVSRNTVVNGYAQLATEGYLTTRVGAGSFISQNIPEDLSSVTMPAGKSAMAAAGNPPQLSNRGGRLLNNLRHGLPANPYSNPDRVFRLGIPDLEAFPFDNWRRLQAQALRQLSSWEFSYRHPRGFLPLREALAAYLKAARGVDCDPDQIIITAGSQQGLFLAAMVLLDQGDPVWVEDPGYPGARRAFSAAGAEVMGVPVDEAGLDLERGQRTLSAPKFVYLTPSHQFPTGVTMPLARRLRLLEWATEKGIWLLEDDYDSEYRYQGQPVPALQGLDQYGRVIYVGSFSKVLFPGLRLGYIVAPADAAEALLSARSATALNPPLLAQATLTEFINQGEFGRHIRRMRVEYGRRAEALVTGLRAGLEGKLAVPPIKAGLHLALELPPQIDDFAAAGQAIEHQVQVAPLSIFGSDELSLSGLVLGFGGAKIEAIRAGCSRLSRALTKLL